MNILKSLILAIATAGSLGVFALSSATPASAGYYGYYRPYYHSYYRSYSYCQIRYDYYGNPYKVCF